MYLLYLDSSGHPDFPPPYGGGKDANYVLAGLAITDDKYDLAYTGLNQIVVRYFPKVSPGSFEVKYGDLINRRGLWNTLTDLQRKNFADDIFSLIFQIEPVLFAIKIDKVAHYNRYSWGRTGAEHPRLLSVRFMVPRFSKFLQRIGQRGIMIYDSETAYNDRPIRDFLLRGRFRGIVVSSNPFYNPLSVLTTQNKLQGIIDTIFFAESHASPVTQLVDFCAYAIWSHFERHNSNRFNQIHPLFDHVGTTVYGLKEWP